MSFEKIANNRGRQEQLQSGQSKNIFVRASEFNPIVDYLNNSMGEVTSAAANSATGNSVTLNTQSGKITTAALTTAADTAADITLTNSKITATSNVIAWIEDYSGTIVTDGIPVIINSLPAAGSAVITICNIHATNALDGTLIIKFIVL